MTSVSDIADYIASLAALRWHVDQGMDEVLADEPGLLARMPAVAPAPVIDIEPAQPVTTLYQGGPPSAVAATTTSRVATITTTTAPAPGPLQGTPELKNEAIKLAASAKTLDELREALAGFEGLAIRKTATNMVFCDGNPAAPIMLIGEAPGADEDRLGKPFVGVSGQLLDKILKCIDLDRAQEDPERAIYISNILNWRPPGNRTPTPQEVELSLPFIERHIVLAKPKLLIFSGGVSAKALLNTDDGISKLRGRFHSYTPRTPGIAAGFETDPIPALATYHPSYLLRTPGQKKAVWQDMLTLLAKSQELGISAKAA